MSDIEQIRKEHIEHEASIRNLGGLYFLGGLGMAMIVVTVGFAIFSDKNPVPSLMVAGSVLALALGILFFWLSGGLRQLRLGAKSAATILAAVGLLIFPVGTIINACVLYLLLSAKGSMVFSGRYQDIIAATPHIRYRTSPVIYVLFGLIAINIAILFGIIA